MPADPECSSLQDNDENPFNPGRTKCSDGIDNDNDGAVDLVDPGCLNKQTTNTEIGKCQDGIDNDNDNAIDYPNDIGCSNLQDNSE